MLKTTTLKETPYQELTDWVADGSEFKTELVIKPLVVIDDDTVLTLGVVGTLATGEWGYEGNQVYVKDDPTTSTMEASKEYLVMTGAAGKETICISTTISNPSDNDAKCVLYIADTDDVVKAVWLIEASKANSLVGEPIPQKLVIEPTDKLMLMSSEIDTNIYISYNEA